MANIKISKKLDSFLRLCRAYYAFYSHFLYDLKRFAKHSIKSTYPIDNETQITAKFISLYHVIEKGLIMPETRLGFGEDRIKLLIKLLKLYKLKFSTKNNTHYNSALKVLKSYMKIHEKSSFDLDYIKFFLEKEDITKRPNGGYFEVEKEYFYEKSKGNFLELSEIRSSIRNFSEKPVLKEDIYKAIKIAQKSPSTCNRQSSRVYLISNKKQIKNVLELQGGSRGFGHKIDKLLMIGFDNNSYQGGGDRYSGYIDASLFAMSLIYALTYLRLGSVSLNWSKTKEVDLKLRNLIDIKDSHNIIFFIGVGHLENKTKIAVSNRFDISEILIEYRL